MVKQRILLTGSTGFIGSNLLRHLSATTDSALFAVLRKESNPWRIRDLIDSKKVSAVESDLTRPGEAASVLDAVKPDTVINSATYGMFMAREKDRERIIDVNVNLLCRLVAESANRKIRKFVHVGSSSEYGLKPKAMKEDMVLEPVNTYGASKAAGTIIASQLARELSFPLVTLRLFSPYGYYEDPGRLLPTLVASYLDGKKPSLSSRTSVRDFTFIEDIVEAFVRVIESDTVPAGEVVNIATGVQHSTEDVVSALKKLTKSGLDPEWGKVPPRQAEPKVWKAEVSKAKRLLKWTSRFNLESGLAKAIDWYAKNRHLYLKNQRT